MERGRASAPSSPPTGAVPASSGLPPPPREATEQSQSPERWPRPCLSATASRWGSVTNCPGFLELRGFRDVELLGLKLKL